MREAAALAWGDLSRIECGGAARRSGAAGVGGAGAREVDEPPAGEAVGASGRGGGVLAAPHGRGYHPVAVDVTAFYRPRLQGCPTSPYHATAGQALPAIPVGIIARIGSVAQQRFGVPLGLVRADSEDPSPSAHRRALLKRAVELQASNDVLVTDREFTVGQLQATGATVWVTRLLKNVTARRAGPPAYGGRGRPPKYGDVVRPLARRRKGQEIKATPPNQTTSWTDHGSDGERTLRAEQWTGLVLPDAARGRPTFTILRQAQDRDLRPGLHRAPAGGHAAHAVATGAARAVSRPLAGRATPARGQADAGRGASVRARAGDLSTLPRSSPSWPARSSPTSPRPSPPSPPAPGIVARDPPRVGSDASWSARFSQLPSRSQTAFVKKPPSPTTSPRASGANDARQRPSQTLRAHLRRPQPTPRSPDLPETKVSPRHGRLVCIQSG